MKAALTFTDVNTDRASRRREAETFRPIKTQSARVKLRHFSDLWTFLRAVRFFFLTLRMFADVKTRQVTCWRSACFTSRCVDGFQPKLKNHNDAQRSNEIGVFQQESHNSQTEKSGK